VIVNTWAKIAAAEEKQEDGTDSVLHAPGKNSTMRERRRGGKRPHGRIAGGPQAGKKPKEQNGLGGMRATF